MSAKKKTRRLPSRKLRRVQAERRINETVDLITEMIPETTRVIGLAVQAGVRTLNELAIEQLRGADKQLAEQLVALITKKRST